jgi:hypothetical protein
MTTTATLPSAEAISIDTTAAPLAAPAPTYFVPKIGQPWPGQGGIYVGLAKGVDGGADEHLVLLAGFTGSELTHAKALEWATKQTADGHTDFRLPNRDESALLYAHVREHIDTNYWYWTSSVYGASYAWTQHFYHGTQCYRHKSAQGAAVAVRRFAA